MNIMDKNKTWIYQVLQVIAWVIFVGLCIDAGALIVNFIYSHINPMAIQKLYHKLDLSQEHVNNKPIFYGVYSFIMFISILKAFLFYNVIQLGSVLNLERPFVKKVADKIYIISTYTFSIGLISLIARSIIESFSHYGFSVVKVGKYLADGNSFILMSAIIYTIAFIFYKGVSLQSESELTI
jgi:hypothetical protein